MSELHVRFGEQLRKVRLEKKLELADVASELRMSEEHIAAVEAGDATRVPGPLFLQLFGRSYASFLGVDYADAMDNLREELGEPSPPSTTSVQRDQKIEILAQPQPTRAGGGTRIFLGVLVTVVVLAGLSFVGYKLLQQNKDVVTQKERSGKEAETEEFLLDGETLSTARPYESAFATDSIDGLTLSLLARVPSSILLITDGDTAMNGEMKIAQDYQFDARQRLVISLGAPEAVDIRLNGQKAVLLDSRTKKVTNLELTLGNYRWYLTPDSMTQADSLTPQDSVRRDSLKRLDAASNRTKSSPNTTGGNSGAGF